jgi:hypothetical protein
MNALHQLAVTSIVTASVAFSSVGHAAGYELSDLNGDGVISADEIRTIKAAHRAQQLATYDADGNGTLSRDERRAMRDARYDEMLSMFDSDGDGELSRAERKAAKQARRSAREASLDVNGDGEISDAEKAGFEEIKAERGTRKHGGAHGKKQRHNSDDQSA